MRIGRDHIASTVYTIAFAYAGAALPVLILVMLYERPLGDALTSAELSEEVIRTLVGSVGLVLAIPVTTLIAVLVVKATGIKASGISSRQRRPQRRRCCDAPAAGRAGGQRGRRADGVDPDRAGRRPATAPTAPVRRAPRAAGREAAPTSDAAARRAAAGTGQLST